MGYFAIFIFIILVVALAVYYNQKPTGSKKNQTGKNTIPPKDFEFNSEKKLVVEPVKSVLPAILWEDSVVKPDSNLVEYAETTGLPTPEVSEPKAGKYLVVDTETTGLPRSKYAPIEESSNWPYILQISWILLDESFRELKKENCYLDYKGEIPIEAYRVNKISKELLREKGEPTKTVLKKFLEDVALTEYIVCHNVDFDFPIILAELHRNGFNYEMAYIHTICTMHESKYFVNVYDSIGRIKSPRLEELYHKCFNDSENKGRIVKLHDASADVAYTAQCLKYLVENDHLDRFKQKKPKSRQKKVLPKKEFTPEPIESDDDYMAEVIKEIHSRADTMNRFLIEREEARINLSDSEKAFDKTNPFYLKNVVITGVYINFSRDNLKALMKKLGAKVLPGVSGNVDILITGEEPGPSKIAKMNEFILKNPEKEIIDELKLLSMIDGIILDQFEYEGKIKTETILIENGKFFYNHSSHNKPLEK